MAKSLSGSGHIGFGHHLGLRDHWLIGTLAKWLQYNQNFFGQWPHWNWRIKGSRSQLMIRRSLVPILGPPGWAELHVEVSLSKILNPKMLLRVLQWAGDSSRVYPAFTWRQLDWHQQQDPRPHKRDKAITDHNMTWHCTVPHWPNRNKDTLILYFNTFNFDYGRHSPWHHFNKLMQCYKIYLCPELH